MISKKKIITILLLATGGVLVSSCADNNKPEANFTYSYDKDNGHLVLDASSSRPGTKEKIVKYVYEIDGNKDNLITVLPDNNNSGVLLGESAEKYASQNSIEHTEYNFSTTGLLGAVDNNKHKVTLNIYTNDHKKSQQTQILQDTNSLNEASNFDINVNSNQTDYIIISPKNKDLLKESDINDGKVKISLINKTLGDKIIRELIFPATITPQVTLDKSELDPDSKDIYAFKIESLSNGKILQSEDFNLTNKGRGFDITTKYNIATITSTLPIKNSIIVDKHALKKDSDYSINCSRPEECTITFNDNKDSHTITIDDITKDIDLRYYRYIPQTLVNKNNIDARDISQAQISLTLPVSNGLSFDTGRASVYHPQRGYSDTPTFPLASRMLINKVPKLAGAQSFIINTAIKSRNYIQYVTIYAETSKYGNNAYISDIKWGQIF